MNATTTLIRTEVHIGFWPEFRPKSRFRAELKMTEEVRARTGITARANWKVIGHADNLRDVTKAAEVWLQENLPNAIVVFKDFT